MGKITYTNKVALNENPEVADINKVTDDDMNEIKSVVNTNDDNVGDITILTTTTKTSTVSAINELNSTKATSNDLGNIANLTTTDKTSVVNAVNELNSNKASKNEVIISDTQPTEEDNKLWIDTGEIGSQVSEITNSYSTSTGLGYSANYVNGLNTYSTTEQVVGTWNDKPLYRQIITIPALLNNSTVYATIDSTFNVVDYQAYVTNPGNYRHKLPVVGSNYIATYLEWTSSNVRLCVVTTSDRTAFTDNYAIIYYTKTTD